MNKKVVLVLSFSKLRNKKFTGHFFFFLHIQCNKEVKLPAKP